ncbi:MAG: hypothetical protein ACREX9_19685, partial [Gammaproteobacteria bacterium]
MTHPVQPNQPEPELFASGTCDARLPVREVIEAFDFGQFVDLVVVDDQGDRHHVVVDPPNALKNSGMRGMLLSAASNHLRSVDVLGGVLLLDVARGRIQEPFITGTLVDEVRLPSVDRFLAEREIELGGQNIKAPVATEEIRTLLAGKPVVLSLTTGGVERLVRLLPQASESEGVAMAPAVTHHVVN